ncbi:hypothetical protein PHMEG_00018546 [Phytophthora megakarya]|uniref:Uncharacterized protein n=1 Tax=Phytophthora megakarya TaxID=4795 RepID=A0A225VVC6_9STRA|nr:hypothetical protein PHMEG_00018546 [Phytophthora megakarya]
MDIKQEPGTGAQAPNPAPPAIGHERIGMPDDAEEMSNASAHERGDSTETGTNPPATEVPTLAELKESNTEMRALQIAMQ